VNNQEDYIAPGEVRIEKKEAELVDHIQQELATDSLTVKENDPLFQLKEEEV